MIGSVIKSSLGVSDNLDISSSDEDMNLKKIVADVHLGTAYRV